MSGYLINTWYKSNAPTTWILRDWGLTGPSGKIRDLVSKDVSLSPCSTVSECVPFKVFKPSNEYPNTYL